MRLGTKMVRQLMYFMVLCTIGAVITNMVMVTLQATYEVLGCRVVRPIWATKLLFNCKIKLDIWEIFTNEGLCYTHCTPNWTLITVLGIITIAACFKVYMVIMVNLPRLYSDFPFSSVWLAQFAVKIVEMHVVRYDNSVVRKEFRKIQTLPSMKKACKEWDNVPHGQLASWRSVVQPAIAGFAKAIGAPVVSLYGAAADLKMGHLMFRPLITTADMKEQMHVDEVPKNALLLLVDVAGHIDLKRVLRTGHITIIYETVMRGLHVQGRQMSYWGRNDNSLMEMVQEGGDYIQKHVWNTHKDHVKIPTDFGFYTYTIDKIKTHDPDKQLILFYPTGWCPFSIRVIGDELEKLQFGYDGFNCLKFNTERGVFASIGECASDISVTLPINKLYQLWVRCRDLNTVTGGDNQRILLEYSKCDIKFSNINYLEDSTACMVCVRLMPYMEEIIKLPVLGGFMTVGEPKQPRGICDTEDGALPPAPVKGPVVVPLNEDKPCDDPKGPLAVRKYKPIVTHPSIQIGHSLSGDTNSVDQRITKVKNEKEWSAQTWGYATEFIAFEIPEENCLVPLSASEVIDRINNPSTKADTIRDDLIHTICEPEQKTKTKNELLLQMGSNRLFSGMGAGYMQNQTAVIAPADDYVKSKDHVAFGKTRKQFSEHVTDMCKAAERNTVEMDQTSCDGARGRSQHQFELAYLQRMYDTKHRSSIIEIMNKMYGSIMKTKFGVTYPAWFSRQSGARDTTFGNTIFGEVIMYCAYRRMGLSPKTSYDRIKKCYFGGDDSIVFDMDVEILLDVCLEMGVIAKIQERAPSEPITMLGWWFPEPLTSERHGPRLPNMLGKLGISVHTGIPVEVVMHWAADGIEGANMHVPFLMAIARAIRRLIPVVPYKGYLPRILDRLGYFYAIFEEGEEFTNDDVARQLEENDVSSGDVEAWIRQIDAAESWDDMPVIPNNPIKIKQPVLVDGLVLCNKNNIVKERVETLERKSPSSITRGIAGKPATAKKN